MGTYKISFASFTKNISVTFKINKMSKSVQKSCNLIVCISDDSFLPAWIVVLLIALGEVVFGGILYLILKRVIIDPPIAGFYSVQRGDNTSSRS